MKTYYEDSTESFKTFEDSYSTPPRPEERFDNSLNQDFQEVTSYLDQWGAQNSVRPQTRKTIFSSNNGWTK